MLDRDLTRDHGLGEHIGWKRKREEGETRGSATHGNVCGGYTEGTTLWTCEVDLCYMSVQTVHTLPKKPNETTREKEDNKRKRQSREENEKCSTSRTTKKRKSVDKRAFVLFPTPILSPPFPFSLLPLSLSLCPSLSLLSQEVSENLDLQVQCYLPPCLTKVAIQGEKN